MSDRAGQSAASPRPRLLVVGHAASRSGSPKVLLEILRWLAANSDFEISLVLAEGGPLLDDFRRCVPTVALARPPRKRGVRDYAAAAARMLRLRGLERQLRAEIRRNNLVSTRGLVTTDGFDVAYVNSVAALPYLDHVPGGCPLVLHVHELQYAVNASLPGDGIRFMQIPDRYIAVSAPVTRMLVEDFGIDPGCIVQIPECLGDAEAERTTRSAASARTELGLPVHTPVVLGCGTLDWRKGFDLFLATARQVAQTAPDLCTRFYWVGSADQRAELAAEVEIDKSGLQDMVVLVPEREDPRPFFDAADVFLMSSREDPYPLVVLEAALAERPVVCQSSEAGGAADFVSRGTGLVASYLDVDGLAGAVVALLRDPATAREMGIRGRRLVIEEHLTTSVAPAVLTALSGARR